MENLTTIVGHGHFSWHHVLFLSSEISASSDKHAVSLKYEYEFFLTVEVTAAGPVLNPPGAG